MTNRMSTGGWRVLLTAGASALAFAVSAPALAQELDVIDDQADEADEKDTGDNIVVTGSRIRRNEFTSAAPVQIIDPTIGELQGQFDTATLIQSSSVAAGSAQVTAAISSNFVTNGGSGASTVSLRGLGAERTLVLLNGRRAGPAGTRGGVNAFDLNVIPQSVIGTVEILKDGASSVYGSDAVAGVVNILTKTDLDGLELDGFYQQPFKDGGEQLRGSAAYGKQFSRGHIQVAFDYFKQEEVARRDRKYLDCAEEYIFDPDTGDRADLRDPRPSGLNFSGPSGFSCRDLLWGHIWLYDYTYYYSPNGSNLEFPNETGGVTTVQRAQFDYDGNLGNFIPPFAAPLDPAQFGLPSGFFPVGYDRASSGVENAYSHLARNDTVVPEIERFTIYADTAFELTDSIEIYGEVLANRRETATNGSRQFWNFTLTSDFPLFGLPPDPVVNPEITGAVLISPTAFTDHSDNFTRVDYIRTMGGLRGEFKSDGFLDGWQWDLYGQYSRSDGKYTDDRILQDAVDLNDFPGRSDGTGCAGEVTPVSGRACFDIDFNDPQFLAGNFTQAQRDLLFDVETGNTIYKQLYFEGFFTGDIIDLPAGKVAAAVGGTWRRDKINDVPGPVTLANNAWGSSGAGITKGASNTKEIFGEINIPLLRDAPLVQSFTASGSLRWTDVSTAGSDVTWSAGFNWQVVDPVRLRGTWGTSFRAPALFELFLADQTSFANQRAVDPCIQWGPNLASGTISQQLADNCAAQGVPPNHTGAGVSATIVTGGGLGVVDPETSTAKTVGIVLTPDFLVSDDAKLEIAVDYFNIEVNGEIGTLSAGEIVAGCLTSDFFPTDPLCSLFTRGQTGAPSNINEVRASFININSQKNSGLDVTMRYQHEALIMGWDLDVLAQFTRQFKDTVALFEGTETSVNGEDGEPLWVGDVNILFNKNDWTLFWGMDIVGPTSDEEDFFRANGTLCPTDTIHGTFCVDLKAETTVYHALSVTKNWDTWRFTAGVANLFDEAPPRVSTINRSEISTIGQSVFASNYDLIGRRAFLNIKKSF